MDLAVWPARLMARGMARVLDMEGSTPQEWRDEILRDISLPAYDNDELVVRHTTRVMVWLAVLAVVFPASIPVAILMWIVTGGVEDPVYQIFVRVDAGILFFVFGLMCVHVTKYIIAEYLLNDRWNPGSRCWRAAMLSQVPDVGIASAAAALVALSL